VRPIDGDTERKRKGETERNKDVETVKERDRKKKRGRGRRKDGNEIMREIDIVRQIEGETGRERDVDGKGARFCEYFSHYAKT
jgi:hypothetical protein